MSGRLRPLEPSEAEEVAHRRAVSFGATGDRDALLETVTAQLEAGEYLGWEVDGRVYAQCRVSVVDHWFGGRRVPCQHVASVAVAPEHRGRGVARALMAAVVERGAAEGAGLSLLFPATTRAYRSSGYEHAGVFTRYRVEARTVPALGPNLRPVRGEADSAAIRACAERAARRLNGPEVRSEARWATLREARFAYVLDGIDPGTVDAYVLFDHVKRPGDWRYDLKIRDWAATTPTGMEAVVGLIGSHGSLGHSATFRGTLPEPWSLLLAEQDVALEESFWWMGRGLDLQAAIAARGFPSGLAASVTFAVDDPLLPAARGPWRLDVADGEGRLRPFPGADVRLDVRAVGPLFTGFRDPETLRLAGLVRGPDDALRLLGEIFAGPTPVLLDFF